MVIATAGTDHDIQIVLQEGDLAKAVEWVKRALNGDFDLTDNARLDLAKWVLTQITDGVFSVQLPDRPVAVEPPKVGLQA